MKRSEVRTILAITVIAWESLDSAIPKSCRTKLKAYGRNWRRWIHRKVAGANGRANNDVRLRLRTEIRRRIRKLPVRATVAK